MSQCTFLAVCNSRMQITVFLVGTRNSREPNSLFIIDSYWMVVQPELKRTFCWVSLSFILNESTCEQILNKSPLNDSRKHPPGVLPSHYIEFPPFISEFEHHCFLISANSSRSAFRQCIHAILGAHFTWVPPRSAFLSVLIVLLFIWKWVKSFPFQGTPLIFEFQCMLWATSASHSAFTLPKVTFHSKVQVIY